PVECVLGCAKRLHVLGDGTVRRGRVFGEQERSSEFERLFQRTDVGARESAIGGGGGRGPRPGLPTGAGGGSAGYKGGGPEQQDERCGQADKLGAERKAHNRWGAASGGGHGPQVSDANAIAIA